MSWRSTRGRFGTLAILFHWLMLILIVAAYATMELKGLTPRRSPQRAALALWHYGFGLSVFLLVWLRLVTRAADRTPAIVPPPALWEHRLAALGHFLLYVFMIATPFLGWLTVSAQGETVAFMGWQLPLLLSKNEPLARQLKDAHETLANVGYGLIALHVAAALYHHYVRRDNTMALMWPREPAHGARR